MSATLHPEWLNENSLRAYPFQEDMQRIPVDPYGNQLTDAILPNYVVVDFVITFPAPDGVRMYLSSLAVVGRLMTLGFSETRSNTLVCTVSLDRSTHQTNTAYDLVGTGAWSDARGRIVLGELSRLPDDVADGLYGYTADQTLLEACVVRPSLRGVRSLQIQNGVSLSDKLYGNIKLIAGPNIVLSLDPLHNGIVVSAVPNANYSAPCDCESVLATNVLRSINGISVQDLTLVPVSSCLQITASGSNLLFTDTCSTPCCGCEELTYLTDTLKNITTGLSQLEAFMQAVDARLNTFVTNYLLTI